MTQALVSPNGCASADAATALDRANAALDAEYAREAAERAAGPVYFVNHRYPGESEWCTVLRTTSARKANATYAVMDFPKSLEKMDGDGYVILDKQLAR